MVDSHSLSRGKRLANRSRPSAFPSEILWSARRFESPNFATQSYTLDTARGGTDTSIIFSVNVNPAAFFAFDKSFRGGVSVVAR